MALPTPGVTPSGEWAPMLNAEIAGIQTSAARRGGKYGPVAGTPTLPTATSTYPTLETKSGDSDMISAGKVVIPSDGLWSLSANWPSGSAQNGRTFMDIDVGGVPYRFPIVGGEDRSTGGVVLSLAASTQIRLGFYSLTQSGLVLVNATLDCYRVGI